MSTEVRSGAHGRAGGDVVIGVDGTPGCAWAGAGDTALGRYHDEVWGAPTSDESALFEALTLGVFEVGLSWSIVFGKRDALRAAFRGFDPAAVAAMTERDVDRLTQDAAIVRNPASADASGVAGTPIFLINGKRCEGAYNLATLTAAVRASRARAAARRLCERPVAAAGGARE